MFEKLCNRKTIETWLRYLFESDIEIIQTSTYTTQWMVKKQFEDFYLFDEVFVEINL